MNYVVLRGTSGRDGELKYTASGKGVLRGTVAINEKWGEQERTTWVPFTLWVNGDPPSFAKGDTLVIEGRLSTYKKEGDKYEQLQMTATKVVVVPKGPPRAARPAHAPAAPRPQSVEAEHMSEDIPF